MRELQGNSRCNVYSNIVYLWLSKIMTDNHWMTKCWKERHTNKGQILPPIWIARATILSRNYQQEELNCIIVSLWKLKHWNFNESKQRPFPYNSSTKEAHKLKKHMNAETKFDYFFIEGGILVYYLDRTLSPQIVLLHVSLNNFT